MLYTERHIAEQYIQNIIYRTLYTECYILNVIYGTLYTKPIIYLYGKLKSRISFTVSYEQKVVYRTLYTER